VKRGQDPRLTRVARGRARHAADPREIQFLFLNVELVGPQIKVIAVVQPGQEDLVGTLVLIVAFDAIAVGEILVGLGKNVPAEGPARVDLKAPLRANHRAGALEVGTGRVEGVETTLANSSSRDRIGS